MVRRRGLGFSRRKPLASLKAQRPGATEDMTTHRWQSLVWSPTIALSWLWGLGFFYAIHVTLTYGWLGFAAFALPNALGLFGFGWLLGAPGRDPARILRALEGAYAGIFLLCQLFAVAITIFGFAAYLWRPLVGANEAAAIGLMVLVACAVGQSLRLGLLRHLHTAYLVAGVAAGLVALAGLAGAGRAAAVPVAAFDDRFYGLVLPSLIGFLLGPWLDVQHWQRAVEIRREGGSVRLAYGGGALLFLGLLVLNALLAAASGPGLAVSADGIPGAQPSVAMALARDGVGMAGIAYLAWGAIAAISTIDSFYVATRWLVGSLTSRSNAPLLAFVPQGLVSSPLWILAAALALAYGMLQANLSLMYLMLPFATLLVGGGVCLVCEALGARRRYDPVLCYLIGLAAVLVFLAGYVAPVPAFLALAPLIALIGAIPTILDLAGRGGPDPKRELVPVDPVEPPAKVALVRMPSGDASASHGFDGQSFVLRLVPTYDDTNSVGNVYFANYIRWVGKAREMFFNLCMPKFDLATTGFYVLTHSFTHDFRREAREFEAITVRIRIAEHNRKFVTLAHEIHSETQGLLGRGSQSLMFVDTEHYRPLDIPRSIVEGFLPYWPKSSPHADPGAQAERLPAAAS